MSEQKFPPKIKFSRLYPSVELLSGDFEHNGSPIHYLSFIEHQHLMADKDRRIDRLEHCLEWLTAGFAGMWGSETKMWYDHALETAPEMIRAALQEDGK